MMSMKGPQTHTPTPESLFPAVQAELSLREHCQHGDTQGTTHVCGHWQSRNQGAHQESAVGQQSCSTARSPGPLDRLGSNWAKGSVTPQSTSRHQMGPRRQCRAPDPGGLCLSSQRLGLRFPCALRSVGPTECILTEWGSRAAARCPSSWRAGRPPGVSPHVAPLPDGAARAQDKGLPGLWTESGGRGRYQWRGSGGRGEKREGAPWGRVRCVLSGADSRRTHMGPGTQGAGPGPGRGGVTDLRVGVRARVDGHQALGQKAGRPATEDDRSALGRESRAAGTSGHPTRPTQSRARTAGDRALPRGSGYAGPQGQGRHVGEG